MSENTRFNINNLVDIETEESLLRALMEFDTDETVMALVKLKRDHFHDEGHQDIFEVLRELETRNFKLQIESVRTELMKEHPKLIDTLMRIALVEPVAAVMFAVESLEEWQKKRVLFRGLSLGLQNLQEGNSSLQCANDVGQVVDDVGISSVDDFTSYAMLKKRLEDEPPIAKVPTGLSFLDVKLKNGIEYGQFIGVMGDPEAGKTVIVTQILRHISSLGHETLFFNFEFHYRSFIENNKINEDKFSLDKFLMENENNDILDIEAKIKIFAKRGGKVVAIDSQMMITNVRSTGTSSERETEKFFILQRLAIKYELIIMLIAQQGKEDTRSGTVSPMGSKNAAHALHQIWYIKKPKLEFGEYGLDYIVKMRKEMSVVEFKRQYMQDAGVSEAGHFDKHDFTYVTDVEIPEQNIYITIDSAESEEKAADNRAIVVTGKSVDASQVVLTLVMDGAFGLWEVYETCAQIIAMMIKYPTSPVHIEGAGGGITMHKVLRREILIENAKLQIAGKPQINNGIFPFKPDNQTSKNAGIKLMTNPLEQHTLKFYKFMDSLFLAQLKTEFKKFNPEKTNNEDDCIDALSKTYILPDCTAKINLPPKPKPVQRHRKRGRTKTWRGV